MAGPTRKDICLWMAGCGVLAVCALRMEAEPVHPQAPPPAPPIEIAHSTGSERGAHNPPPGVVLWVIGEPTDEEQLYLEYINRARANPAAEGERLAATSDPDVRSAYSFFGVDLNRMRLDLAGLAPAAPLAMSVELLAAARRHSWDMATNRFQGHTGSDGSSPGDRINRVGYPWQMYGENVFAYARSVFHGHAAFEVDWGVGPYGMQEPPGHRLNIHQAAFREVGIGVLSGVSGGVGPQVVTQDFATRTGAKPFVTGVVYYDLNGNGFYDMGEGIGGVEVIIPGNGWYGRTAVSGGYAVPVPADGVYLVQFVAPGLHHQVNALVTNLANTKVDLIPSYEAPFPVGPVLAALTNDNLYVTSVVGGATNYHWEVSRLQSGSFFEGAEGDLAQVTLDVSAGYATRITDRVAAGSYAFHLAHPTPPAPQVLRLNPIFWIRTNTQLRFASRLGWATTNQIARAQISFDDGLSWTNLWSRVGSGSSGDASYQSVSLPLGIYAGRAARLRFVYDYVGGTYYPQTSSDVGWLVDNLEVIGADRILAAGIHEGGPEGKFVFRPDITGSYLLRVRAQLPGRTLPWGALREVQAQVLPAPVLRFTGPLLVQSGELTASFEVLSGRSGLIYRLWRSAHVGGPWVEVRAARFEAISGVSMWRVRAPLSGNQGYYRLTVN
ncbi:MAG: CAP domain-containing protein [Verrucomicrobiota bacterium]|nr:CAP domain-containing protein [Limisphaera sp.]MDW8382757.1 CAP domain-containing protein [Verrucomicrobiota bacterium]